MSSTLAIYINHCLVNWVGKAEGNRPGRKPRHRWKNNIRMNLTEVEWEIRTEQRLKVGCCEHRNEPLDSTICRNLLNLLSN